MAYVAVRDPRTGAVRADIVVRESDGATIPADPGNLDWQAYEAWRDDGNTLFVPPAPPAPVPEIISDRQFAQALAEMGAISKAEALAFVKRGEVPATLQAAIDGIADDEPRFAADMEVSGATTFARQHPSTLALARSLNWSAAQMDALWTRAAAL